MEPLQYVGMSLRYVIDMMEKKKLFVSILLVFVILPTIVQATTLSSVQKKRFVEVRQGDTAEFTVLFWNLEDDHLFLSFKPREYPENWVVMVRPDEVLLEKSHIGPPYEGEEYIGIPGVGDVEVFPVKVFVKVPIAAELGEYEVSVTVTAGKGGPGISVLQERTFRFTADVKGHPSFFDDIGKAVSDTLGNLIKLGGDAVNNLTGMFSSAPFEIQITILIASVVIVLAALWVIYKHV